MHAERNLPTHRARRRIALTICIALVVGVPHAVAPKPAAARSTSNIGAPELEKSEPSEKDKQRVATAGVWLVAGIAVVGSILIGAVVWGGFHVRRKTRRPGRATQPRDELWYLKPDREPQPPQDGMNGDEE